MLDFDAIDRLFIETANRIRIEALQNTSNSEVRLILNGIEYLNPIERVAGAPGFRLVTFTHQQGLYIIRCPLNQPALRVARAIAEVYISKGYEVELVEYRYHEQGNGQLAGIFNVEI